MIVKALIVGGGIIGASCAWRLASEGIAVTALERGRLGQEASWAAAGLIGPQGEADAPGPFFDLCMAGKESFDRSVERLMKESGVDPEYDRQGMLYVAFSEAEREELSARARWQRAAGATAEELTPAQATKIAPALSPKITSALHLPTNWRTDNRKLTQAYIGAAINAGAVFREGVRVDAIATKNGRANGIVTSSGETLHADVIINAAGSWAGELRGLEADNIRFFPVRGQIICFDTRPGLIGPSLFSPRGILVPRRDGRLLAGSIFEDAGFNKTLTLGGMAHILRAASEMIPSLSELPFREAWAGLRPAVDDLMPVIGPSPSIPNVFYASGHFRSGILLSSLTGEIIADLVKERAPKINLAPFSPTRFQNGIAKAPLKVKSVV
jgi:glycine oxidase